MERPPKKYVCEKCGYLGDTSEHEGCDYLAWTTGEQLYIDHLERELALLKASPASASVAAPDYRIADRGFRWDAENRQHIPQLLIEFTPVPENAPNASSGWKDRDKLAAMLVAAPTPPVSEDRWLPIETAPKDEFVLLAGPSGYTTIETVFSTGRMCSDYHVGSWIDHANDDLTDWGFEPTHWMPLPKAPTMQEDKKP